MQKSIIAILSVVICFSCSRSYKIVTRVLPEGTGYREYIITSDSALLKGDTSKNKIPVLIDSSYNVKFYSTSPSGKQIFSAHWPVTVNNQAFSGSKDILISFRKDYKSLNDLSKSNFYNNTSWKRIAAETKISKKFRWFYTEYIYMETFPGYNPFHKIPVSKYLTDEEIAIYTGTKNQRFAKKDSVLIEAQKKQIESKVMDWLAHSIYEEFFTIALSNLHSVNISSSDSIKFVTSKDSIYSLLNKSEDLNPQHFTEACTSYLKNDAFMKLLDPENKASEDFKKFDKVLDIFNDDFNFSLLMPGKIYYTNANKVNSDTMQWKLTAYKYFFNDYTITAGTRVKNYWAWCVTGIIVVLGLALFLVSIRKKNI